ncbi:unnamed protein product [Ostreobium quekettii]|uniref:Divergent PAP2 family protein n=1 Tax=Ostreobium quekettii TaxID=121088 RepID=A0A8S1IXE5_9CHLO|nr:unnamed protein product [Ostreobium quekettii]|eukprot:evm.model.scf_1023.2 EVM.evm.TU.scf_1023.2   scf_1023:8142-9820(+)
MADELITHPRGPHSLGGVLINGVLIASLLSAAVAQVLKVFTHRWRHGRWSLGRMLTSGGMPSSHTALVGGLVAAVGVQEGSGSVAFAVATVLWLLVMYDASGVRLAAGRHASVLNTIISELPPEHPVQDGQRLKDSLGHTPLQVLVGAIVGLLVGYFFQQRWVVGR